MTRVLLIILSFTLSVQLFAQEEDKGVWDRYFRVLPEEQSYHVYGQAFLKQLNPNSIKAFVWNIKKAEKPRWKKEFETYATDRDLILLQEAYKNPLFNNTTMGLLNYRWDMAISMLYLMDNETPTGTMIGSRINPTEVFIKHSPDGESVVNTPKSMTFAKYPIKGMSDELLVISIHGINITDYASFTRHMDQAAEHLDKHQGPILFAGDFNTRTQARTHYVLNMMRRYGLKEIHFKNGHRRMKFKFTPNYLDYGFIRGLKVKTAHVDGDSAGSDHKPMLMELEIAQK